jgi:hypothetical protein
VLNGLPNPENAMKTTTTSQASSTKTLAGRLAALMVMVVALGAAAGCGTVAPYERGKLAHPTMAAADSTGFGESHLRAISEGATGGSGGTGSGCGCN